MLINQIQPNFMMKQHIKKAMYPTKLMFIDLIAKLSTDLILLDLMDQLHIKLSSMVRQLNKPKSKSTMPISLMTFLSTIIQLMEITTKNSKLIIKNLMDVVVLNIQEALEDLMDIQAIMM